MNETPTAYDLIDEVRDRVPALFDYLREEVFSNGDERAVEALYLMGRGHIPVIESDEIDLVRIALPGGLRLIVDYAQNNGPEVRHPYEEAK